MKLRNFLGLLGFLCALPGLPAAPKGQDLTRLSANSCRACHPKIYGQWKSSMHAKSSPLEDPIHRAFYESLVGPPDQEDLKKGGKYPLCLKCHAPSAALAKKTDLTQKPSYREGVTCTSCHTLGSFHGTKKPDGTIRHGIDAYGITPSTLQGPQGTPRGTKHPLNGGFHPYPIQANPGLMRTNQSCMGCHDQRNNPHGVPLCQTGDEFAESGSKATCLSCHMPLVEGKADHSFLGGHSPEMVARGLQMQLEVESKPQGSEVRLSLINPLPHKFPTGAPFRNVWVILTARDAKGSLVWTNAPERMPWKEDPQAMLFYALGNQAGDPAPPPLATQVLGDSRLKPQETRVLRYTANLKGATTIQAEAFYDLLLPALKKKFAAKLPAELLESRPIGTVYRDLSGK